MSSDELGLIEETEDTQPQPVSPASEGGGAVRRLKKISLLNGNLGLLLMFAAGIGAIYLLSLRKGPAEASADLRTAELQVNEALARFGLQGDTNKTSASAVVASFYLQTKQRQIPVDHNPFVFRLPNQPVVSQEDADQKRADEEIEKAEAEALEDVKMLQLQSILTGANGATAMISNNLLTEGQKIQGWTVTKIEADRVILQFKERQHILRLPK